MHGKLNEEPARIPAAGPADSPADSAAIRASLRDPEQFAVLYDRYSAVLHRYAAAWVARMPRTSWRQLSWQHSARVRAMT